MFLEVWMIGVLVLAFGFCASYCEDYGKKKGLKEGQLGMIDLLHENKIIDYVIQDEEWIGIKSHGSKKKPTVRFKVL